MLQNDLVGTWKLVNFDIEESPEKKANWGANAQGILIYTVDGHVSVNINRDLPKYDSSAQETLDGCLFYAGTYHLEGRNRVVHTVWVATDPHRRGHEMIREVTLDGDTLTLVGEGAYGVSTVTWEKISET